jgi:hypothetical protein
MGESIDVAGDGRTTEARALLEQLADSEVISLGRDPQLRALPACPRRSPRHRRSLPPGTAPDERHPGRDVERTDRSG